jgi:hypothetical protein
MPIMMRTLLIALAWSAMAAAQALPPASLEMRNFRLQFDPAGKFTLGGDPGWPAMAGTWTMSGDEITLQNDPGPAKCGG